MARKNGTALESLRGLSRIGSLRLDPHVGHELSMQVAARSLGGKETASQRAIIEDALKQWFKKNQIPPKQRAALELLMRNEKR